MIGFKRPFLLTNPWIQARAASYAPSIRFGRDVKRTLSVAMAHILGTEGGVNVHITHLKLCDRQSKAMKPSAFSKM